jgi:ABC-type phosphate transport system permease subunit
VVWGILMSRLDEIFLIENSAERQKALIDYARSLQINVIRAKRDDGDLDENTLAVMIYDALESNKCNTRQNTGLIIGTIFVLIVLGIIIYLAKRLLG